MKVAYITTYDSSDIRNWSGTGGFYIRQALERQGNEIIPIGNLGRKKTPLMALKERYYSKFLKKQYIFREEPSILKSYARQVEKRLKHQDHDLIFCPHTYPIAYLKTKKTNRDLVGFHFRDDQRLLYKIGEYCQRVYAKRKSHLTIGF